MIIVPSIHPPKDGTVQSFFTRQWCVVSMGLGHHFMKHLRIYFVFGVFFYTIDPIRPDRITHTILLSPKDVVG
jgi:hypothetical protein